MSEQTKETKETKQTKETKETKVPSSSYTLSISDIHMKIGNTDIYHYSDGRHVSNNDGGPIYQHSDKSWNHCTEEWSEIWEELTTDFKENISKKK